MNVGTHLRAFSSKRCSATTEIMTPTFEAGSNPRRGKSALCATPRPSRCFSAVSRLKEMQDGSSRAQCA
jgi:hypothetical protein